MRSLLLVCCFASASVTWGIGATSQATPAGLSLSGVILADDGSDTPLGGAIVTVTSTALSHARSQVTDINGRFAFTDLPSGRFAVTANKTPYVGMEYGAKRPGRPGTPITLAGQPIAGVRIKLPRGAAISGFVRDKSGAPLAGLVVQALPLAKSAVTAQPASSVVSDDRGAYRLFGLTPGQYVVAAYFNLNISDLAIPSIEEMDARFADMLRRPGWSGAARVAAEPVRKPEPIYSPSPTFYPGTAMADEAGVMALASGDEKSADFIVSLVAAGSVTGGVRVSDGSSVTRIRAGLDRLGPSISGAPGSNWFVVMLAPGDPRFRFTAVTPGRYILSARSEREPGKPLLWASTEISTTGEDSGGHSLELRPATRLTGRTVFEGASPNPRETGAIRLITTATSAMFVNAVYASNLRQSASAPASIAADGTFAIEDLIPGGYSLEARNTGPWRLRSAMLDGRDVLDVPLEIGSTDVRGMVLTFTQRLASLDGVLTTPANAPATDYSVVVLPTTRSFWRPGARRIRLVRPADTGRFVVSDLPAGEYFVAALTDVDAADLGDAAFLETIVPAAVRVVLGEGASVTQNLRILSTGRDQ